ncbi:transcription factor [Fusarium langsethiae]|uniref:Transcription factor n=1 Tax=Fusarium langsethiae TaxID=179993 RepID=A0A0M9F448_FUSLA|nr:transcription factor [Fusarium langsethiae]GKT99458.1 unnamed protein product [Fusarium langsethiae]GKU15849.1 unnamed protein product [Fusarium langsethiae]
MAPSNDEIEQALLDATYQVYQSHPGDTTVNKVRKQTEENLGLEDGFLSSDKWKKKSKDLIKQRVGKLMDGWIPEEKNEAGSDGEEEMSTGMKRSSPDAESPQPKPKRQKRALKAKPAPKPKPRKAAKKEESDPESEPGESSELSELSDLSEEEKPQKKRKQAPPKKAPPKRKSKKAAVSEDEDGDVAMNSDAETPGNDQETKNGGSASKKATASAEAQSPDGGEERSPAEEGEDNPIVDEEEEYSDVIDEPPKPKRKKKEKKEGTSKPVKSPKAAAKKSSTSDDPNVEEIKKLQGQLVKCGVRKLWHNELKQYGDDAKAKIRHLKKMLADIGMDGRFSESKAREIKERRELLAEVESAQEMSSLWGVEGRGRASRSKSKKIIESDASDAENNDGNNDDDDDDEDNSYAARRKRVRADLAFLGDDDESD